MSAPKWLRPYLPNRSDRLALVSLSDRKPFRAFWPIVLTQIVGGKTWSISFVRHQTAEPISTEQFRMDVAAEMDRLRATTRGEQSAETNESETTDAYANKGDA